MIIKTYLVKDMNEVQELMERDLGPQAMILTTRYLKPKGIASFFSRPKIEVTAAVEENDMRVNQKTPTIQSDQALEGQLNQNLLSLKQFIKKETSSPTHLMSELLKKSSSLSQSPETAAPPQPSGLAHFLIAKGIAESIVQKIVTKINRRLGITDMPDDNTLKTEVLNAVKKELMALINISGPISLKTGQPKICAFVGSPGVGKTTTLMKIALQYRDELQKKVALITLDVHRIGAYEYSSILAENFDLPLTKAAHVSELQEALRITEDYDLILIDTAGCSQYQWQKVDELADILSTIDGLEAYLVISAATKDVDVLGTIQQFSRLNIESLIFTKLDETIADGLFVNACQKTGKSISYLTHGQNVPGDLLIAHAEEMARGLLVQHNAQEFDAIRQLALC